MQLEDTHDMVLAAAAVAPAAVAAVAPAAHAVEVRAWLLFRMHRL